MRIFPVRSTINIRPEPSPAFVMKTGLVNPLAISWNDMELGSSGARAPDKMGRDTASDAYFSIVVGPVRVESVLLPSCNKCDKDPFQARDVDPT